MNQAMHRVACAFAPISLMKSASIRSGNTHKIATISLERSGQHAVINWLSAQLGSTLHLNNCKFIRRGVSYRVEPRGGRCVTTYRSGKKEDTGRQRQDVVQAFLRSASNFENVLYSFENARLSDARMRRVARQHFDDVVLILRDPYNWLASTIQWGQNSWEWIVSKKAILVEYLEQALGQIDFLGTTVHVINYNRWLLDDGYRQSIPSWLGIPYSVDADHAQCEVQPFGGGSSFDGMAVKGTELKHRVLERWKDFERDPAYRRLLDDQRLVQLSREFFHMEPPFRKAA